MEPLRVVQMGIGSIGREVSRMILERNSLKLVAAIDTNPDLVGRSLGEVLGISEASRVKISNDAEAILEQADPDVVVHTTSSRLSEVIRQLEMVAMHGANLVSSTEELLYPRLNYPAETAELEVVALDNNVAILGTGVNPGFVLDTLAVMATAVCRSVDRVEGRRIVDAATRRQPLQRKIGTGLSVEEFEGLVEQNKLGHVGLCESIALVARGMGWKWDKIVQETKPVVAEKEIRTEFFHVQSGQAAGVNNTGWAIVDGEEKIRLNLQMYVGAEEPVDEITIHGDPNMTVRIPGGTPGDQATAAILVNAIPAIADAPPGLMTMLDVPILRCRGREWPVRPAPI